jgi:hypothetical protein
MDPSATSRDPLRGSQGDTGRPHGGPRTGRTRLMRVALALGVFLVASEAGLQLLSGLARSGIGGRLGGAGADDAITILCVGDSHTYGAAVAEEESYPSQLARMLEEIHAPRSVRVVNAGFPGVNSAFVAQRLEQNLLRFRPDLVVVWVGTYNRWNSLETETWQRTSMTERIDHLLLHSKLYRLARVLAATGAGSEPPSGARIRPGDAPPGGGERSTARRDERLPDDELDAGIAHDLERMAALTRALSTPLVVVGYPLREMAGPNRALRRHARRLGIRMVETSRDYARAQHDGHRRDALIVQAAGPHPTGLLYRYVAESIASVVVAELAARKGIEPADSAR